MTKDKTRLHQLHLYFVFNANQRVSTVSQAQKRRTQQLYINGRSDTLSDTLIV